MTSPRRIAVIAVVALVIVSGFGLSFSALAQDNGGDAAEESGYTLEELQKSGEMRNEEFPSLRVLGPGTGIWAVHFEAGPLKSYGDVSARQLLEPDMKIERNRIRFTGSHPWDGQTRNYTFKTVYWHPDTRQVETENGTAQEQYANITGIDTNILSFESGMQKDADLSLRPHYEEAEQVTIFMVDESGAEVARWGPYTHKSVQTTTALPFDASWSSFFPWFSTRFLSTFTVGGIIAVIFGFKFPEKAGKGPGKGVGWWISVTAIISGIALFGWWTQVVALIVAMPYLLAIPPVLLVFITAVEYSNASDLALLEYPLITTTEDPLGDEAPEIGGEKGDMVRIIDMPRGLGFIKDGSIRAFLARYYAGIATVPESDIPKEHPYGGASSIDTKYYVNDFDFTPARWTWELPSLRRTVETDDGVSTEIRLGRIITWTLGLIIGASVTMAVWNTPYTGLALGTLPIIASGATAIPAEVEIEFAPGEYTKAKAARLSEQQSLAKWETFEDLAEAIAEDDTGGYDMVLEILDQYRDRANARLDTIMQVETNGSGASEGDD